MKLSDMLRRPTMQMPVATVNASSPVNAVDVKNTDQLILASHHDEMQSLILEVPKLQLPRGEEQAAFDNVH